MGIELYNTVSVIDPLSLSVRAIESIVLYMDDAFDYEELSEKQMITSAEKGKELLEAVIVSLNSSLPEDEFSVIHGVLSNALVVMTERAMGNRGISRRSFSVEKDLRTILEILRIAK